MKNWKKYLNPLLSIVMLLNIVSQTAVPIVAYAEADVEESIVQVETDEELTLITTAEELIDFIDETVGIENLVIVDFDEDTLRYTALNETDEEFIIIDEEEVLDLEVGAVYASISGVVVEEEDDVYLLVEEAELVEEEDADLDETDPETSTSEEVDADEEADDDSDEADTDVADEDDDSDDEGSEEAGIMALNLPADEGVQTQQEEGAYELSLMHMNDTHARVENFANMYTAIQQFRAANDDPLLFHAGDVFSGTLYFNEFRGEADLAALNLLGIDAMVFGNHEFDLGSPHTALADFVRGANFPFLGTNINFSNEPALADLTESGSNPNIYDELVFERNGERIGVFGLLTEDTANIASPGNVQFENYLQAARDAVASFEAQGIDKIIALTHIGYASSPAYGNDITLANEVDGIDIIIGGHSHTSLGEPVLVDREGRSPTIIVQAGANADNLGTLNVTFNDAGEIIAHEGRLLNVTFRDRNTGEYAYEPSQVILDAIAEYKEAVDAKSNEETGATALVDLPNPRHDEDNDATTDSVRANETELGNLVTDAMLAKTKELYPDTIIAIQNGGGIRAPIAAGPITVGEVINVLPFGNNPVVVDLNGKELKDLFEIAYGANERPAGGLEENGGFLHVSGIEIYFDSTQQPGERVLGMFVEIDGELVEIDGTDTTRYYKVTTNAFTGAGGDSLTPLKRAYDAGRVQDTGAIDWEQLRDYMVQEEYLDGEVAPVREGRINDLRGQESTVLQLRRLTARVNALEAALAELANLYPGLIAEIENLQNQLATLEAALADANADIDALEQEMQDLLNRIAELEAEVEELQPEPTPTPTPDPGTDSGTGTGTGGPGQADPDDDDADGSGDVVVVDGQELPAAGTNMANTLYAGLTIIFAGGVLFVLSKRKRT